MHTFVGPTLRRKVFLLWLCGLTALGLGVRLTYFFVEGRTTPLSGDGVFYHEAANLIADGKGYIDPFVYNIGYCADDPTGASLGFGEADVQCAPNDVLLPGFETPTAAHPPLWPSILAVSSWLGFDSVNEHRLVGLLFGAAGVFMIGLAGRELFGDVCGLVAAGVASVYGYLWLNDVSLMSESLLGVYVSLMTIVAVRWWRTSTWKSAALLGALAGVGGLVRSELLLYGPLIVFIGVVLSLWKRRDWKPLLGQLAVVLAVALVVLSPWLIRNLTVFSRPVLLSPTGTLLAQTNCDQTYGGEKLGYWERYCAEPDPLVVDGVFRDESVRDQAKREKATEYINSHRGRLVSVVMPARVARMFNLYDPVQTARFDILVENRDFRWSIFSLVQYAIVGIAAIFGVVLAWRKRLTFIPAATWPLLVALVAMFGFGNNRYRVSAEPSLLWLSSVAFVVLYLWFTKRMTASRTTQPTATKPN
ncbi:MAG: hypothetical protein RLZZ31_241 [Actinomycetota bacterium]